MKRILLLAFGAVLILGSKASALDDRTAYMVRENNSSTLSLDENQNYSYNSGETPWVYVKFSFPHISQTRPLYLKWTWTSLDNSISIETPKEKIPMTGSDFQIGKGVWNSPPESWWNDNGGPGQWHVDLTWFNDPTPNIVTSADFTVCRQGGIIMRQASCGPIVTPEPLSTTLFLLGGVPILAGLRKKRVR